MPVEGEEPRLSYILRDPNSGAVVVQDLVHLHQSVWTVRALAAGYPGSTTVGEFKIVLPAPRSDLFGANRAQYDAILTASNDGIGLKVEGYLGDHATGTPVVTGVITKMDLPLDGPWTLSGSDTLYWLQQSQMMPGEFFGAPLDGALPTGTNEIVESLICTQEVIWDDDFSNWNGGSSPPHNSGDYHVNAGWSFTSSDPYQGEPALTTTTSGATSWFVTNTSWNQSSQYSFSSISLRGTAVASTPGVGSVGQEVAVILLSDSTFQNGLWFRFVMVQNSANLYDIEVDGFSRAAGVDTVIAQQTGVLTNVYNPFPYEFTVVHTLDTGMMSVKCLLNGQDAGVNFGGSPPSSGRIGVRGGSAAPAALYLNSLQFRGRTTSFGGVGFAWSPSRFTKGTFVSDGGSIPQQITVDSQTHLDMLVLACSVKGSQIRKNCGAGAKADSIDFGPSQGTDHSTQPGGTFREGANIVAEGTTLSNVAEVYATDARINAIPGSNSGGSVTWRRIGSANDMVLTDTVSDVGIPIFEFLQAYGKAIQQRKAAPVVATQLAVVRTPDLVGINNGLGPRELDTVQVTLPTYGLDQVAQIVGYTLDETSGVMTYFLTNFPERALGGRAALQRLQRSADFLTSTYSAK